MDLVRQEGISDFFVIARVQTKVLSFIIVWNCLVAFEEFLSCLFLTLSVGF
jgi:hypothetical protein